MDSDDEAPRKPGAFVYDNRLLVAFVPFLLAGIVPWFTMGIFTTGGYLLLMGLVVMAWVLPATMLGATIEDSKRGFTRGNYVLCISYLCAPPLLVVTLLAVAGFLDIVSTPQALWTIGIVLFASLPAAVFGAIRVLRNRTLPYQDPRT